MLSPVDLVLPLIPLESDVYHNYIVNIGRAAVKTDSGWSGLQDWAERLMPRSHSVRGGGRRGTGAMAMDGVPDLAVTNYNTVCVLLGSGDGTFAAKTGYPAGNGVNSVAIGDMNRDGKPDLVVANYDHWSVSVLLGFGDGTFATKQDYPANCPTSLAVADLNRDGRPDVVVTNARLEEPLIYTVSVLLGKGDGSLARPVAYAAGYYPSGVSIGDFNGDGIQDLAVAADLGVTVYLGDGTGAMNSRTDYGLIRS